MRRPLRPEEARLWSVVASTVRRARPHAGEEGEPTPAPSPGAAAALARAVAPPSSAHRPHLAMAHRPALRVTPEALAALIDAGVGARPAPRAPARHAPPDPGPIEPNRKRRIARAREPIGGRLDLHGHDQERARAALVSFVLNAQADGARAVLVITGKGRGGVGVLKSRVPEWLSEAPARAAVAGVSPAEARHGGDGALYIALKRR